jgi:hypothetical protein
VLLNEFDFSDPPATATSFRKNYLNATAEWAVEDPLDYPYLWTGPVNTGVPTARDLDHDDKTDGPGDAFGFGRFPGQYGMLLLSKFPIRNQQVRTFQRLLWKQMPNALLPFDPGTQQNWYSPRGSAGVSALLKKPLGRPRGNRKPCPACAGQSSNPTCFRWC